MKFAAVLLLVILQLTAVPFFTVLANNAARHRQNLQVADAGANISVAYKRSSMN